jgi:Family of unknown function (DUF6166)
MKRYIGTRTEKGAEVIAIDEEGGQEPLDPRFDLRKHSMSGFNWGFGGSGPAQLSLALLADALCDDEKAQHFYQDFKFKVIGRFAGDTFEISEQEICQKVAALEAERGNKL